MTGVLSSSTEPGFSDAFRVEGPGFVLSWGAAPEAELPPLPVGAVPRLREQTAYPVVLRATGRRPVALVARDPVLLRGLRAADGGRVVFGAVDFGSQVGDAALEVAVDGETALRLAVEVVPTKLDYRADFAALVADTQELLSGLVVEGLRATTHGALPVAEGHATRAEWLALLRHLADDLERALGQIARHPRRGLAREEAPVRADRVRRADAALHRAVRRGAGSGGGVVTGGGWTVRERVPERRAHPTLDTPEHRWLAARVGLVRRELARVAVELAAEAGSPRRDVLRAETDALLRRAERWGRVKPLAAATGEPPAAFASPQLLHAPGYGEAYRALLLLGRALRVTGGPARLALKELHRLYEQWCYLALVRICARVLRQPLPAADLLTEEAAGLRVRLRQGWEHAVRFPLPGGGETVLVYNPRFGGRAVLVPQRPDVLLEVRRAGREAVRVLLDAKYRIDTSPEYAARYGAPGPPEDALNTLHRYRDALGVGTAVALYPATGAATERFAESRLWRAVGGMGVGALPFLPSETRWVEAWVAELLAEG